MGKFDTASFGEGLLQGVIKQMDKQAEEKQREISLERDVRKHVLMKKADMEMNKKWFDDIQKSLDGQQGGFIKETATPAQGMAQIFGAPGVPGSRSGQVPTFPTEETPEGRQLATAIYGINPEATRAPSRYAPTATGGISVKEPTSEENLWYQYNELKKIDDQGKLLDPAAQYRYKMLQNKLGVTEQQQPIVDAEGNVIAYKPKGSVMERAPKQMTESMRNRIGEIRQLKSNNATIEDINEHIRMQGYEPEDFAEELKGYEPPPAPPSKFTKAADIYKKVVGALTHANLKTTSQAVNFIMNKFGISREKAIETIRSMQGAS